MVSVTCQVVQTFVNHLANLVIYFSILVTRSLIRRAKKKLSAKAAGNPDGSLHHSSLIVLTN